MNYKKIKHALDDCSTFTVGNKPSLNLAILLVLMSALLSQVVLAKGKTHDAVNKFFQVNKSHLLFVYHCGESQIEDCRVYCAAGGSKFIESDHVAMAYYAERLRKIDNSLAGFYLVLASHHNKEDKLQWVTLQNDSSCLFEGMNPTAKKLM